MTALRVTCTAAPGVYLISDGATTFATVHRGGREFAEALAGGPELLAKVNAAHGLSAFDLMQEFYLSRYYEPKPDRPSDNVQAAIEFTLDRYARPAEQVSA